MTAPRLRWALLGASWIAESRMIPALRRSGQEIVAVLSGDPERASEYAGRNGIDASGSYAGGLPALDVDAVYISATNDRHRALAEQAAAQGLHVLCEKPLADSVEDARAIVRACERAGVVLGVNHHLVAAGANEKIRELVRSGAIGELRAVRVFHSRLLPEALRGWRIGGGPGAGVLPDVGTHDASLIDALLHPARPREAYAIGVRQGGWGARSDDAAMAVIRFDGDVVVQTHDGFTTPHAFVGMEVLGSAGAIVGTDVTSQDPIGTVALTDDSGRREIPVDDRGDLYDKVVSAFAGAVRGDGRPTVTGEEGLRATLLASALARSAETGSPVHLENWESR